MARHLLRSGEEVDFFLLDDGFQHRRLHREVDLVLLDVHRPLGNGRLLPAGPLRESPRALRRATHLLLTGGGPGEPADESVLGMIGEYAPGASCLRAWYRLVGAHPLAGSGASPVPLAGRSVFPVVGIARPERFRRLLEETGASLRGWESFRDHHLFTVAEVERLQRQARAARAVPVTTAKDAVRLERLVDPDAGWLVLEVELEVEGGWSDLLTAMSKDSGAGRRPQ
jgi:tetraacyldisaccharide 4'-kinase